MKFMHRGLELIRTTAFERATQGFLKFSWILPEQKPWLCALSGARARSRKAAAQKAKLSLPRAAEAAAPRAQSFKS